MEVRKDWPIGLKRNPGVKIRCTPGQNKKNCFLFRCFLNFYTLPFASFEKYHTGNRYTGFCYHYANEYALRPPIPYYGYQVSHGNLGYPERKKIHPGRSSAATRSVTDIHHHNSNAKKHITKTFNPYINYRVTYH